MLTCALLWIEKVEPTVVLEVLDTGQKKVDFWVTYGERRRPHADAKRSQEVPGNVVF